MCLQVCEADIIMCLQVCETDIIMCLQVCEANCRPLATPKKGIEPLLHFFDVQNFLRRGGGGEFQ